MEPSRVDALAARNLFQLGRCRRPAVRLVFSRPLILLLVAAIVLPWLAIGFLLASRNAKSENASSAQQLSAGPASPGDAPTQKAAKRVAASASVTPPAEPPPQVWMAGKKGPWGQIESMLLAIDVPDEFVLVPPAPPVRWSFPGYTKEKVLATLRSVGVSENEVHSLDSSSTWSSADGVVSVEPGDPLILGLAPHVRSRLYSLLVEFPQNVRRGNPVWFRAGAVDWRLQDSGLAPQSVALLKRLLYPQGEDVLLFADFQPALRSLPSDAERKRFMMVLLRKRAFLARLRIDPDTDVEKLSQYWGIGGRRKDLFPFLHALHRIEKGCTISLIYLLPDFARDRLYRHPVVVGRDKGEQPDCFWSAYNFFSDRTDNSAEDTHSITGLKENYDPISAPGQLGDLMILATHDGAPVHAAVFLADDIYFTKNGVSLIQP